MSTSSVNAANVDLLQRLVMLEKRARACEDRRELTFVMVNETNALSSYRQAALWVKEGGTSGRIVSLSGLSIPSENAAFNIWLSDLLARHAAGEKAKASCALTAQPGTEDMRMWQEYLPEKALWVPLPLNKPGQEDIQPGKENTLQAGLVLWRDKDWAPQEVAALALLCEAYAHAWQCLGGGTRFWFGEGGWKGVLNRLRSRGLRLAILFVLMAVMFLPVRQSVLAPAEIVPRDAFTVRTPLQGVVDRITVQPNDNVKEGDLLALIDSRDIEGKLESARQNLAVADAELHQRRQQALLDAKSKSTLGILLSERDQAASEVAYLESMLKRTEIRAERSGVAIFDDPQEWIGRPVNLGERIMVIADPDDIELEAHLSLADAIELHPGTEVRLFMNAEPASPVNASLSRVGYRAVPVADGTLAYRVRAAFTARPDDFGPELRVGLKGTAKLYGEQTFLAVYLLRKPLTTMRLWLGI